MGLDFSKKTDLEVVVHFGAHKTATTFLQRFLKNHQGDLRRSGVGYVPLDVCRESITPFVAKIARGPEGARSASADVGGMWRAISEVAGQADSPGEPFRRLVISDENLAGPALAILNKKVLYPSAANRLRILANQFPGARVKLMVCIRDYADFIPSVYCEVLRRHRLAPLEKMLDKGRDVFLSWPSYLLDIAADIPECEVQFWRYEEFAASPRDVAEAVTGVRLESIEAAVSKKVRPSLTRKSVAVLQAARKHLSDEEHARLATCLIDHMRFDEDSKLTIEDRSIVEDLRNRYREDVAVLLARSEPACGIVRRITR